MQYKDYWYWIRKSLKGIIRLGGSDLPCKKHAEYYYISFKDNIEILNSPYEPTDGENIAQKKIFID